VTAVEYLASDVVLALTDRLLGTPAPIRDLDLLGSALARSQTTVGGTDADLDPCIKAAARLPGFDFCRIKKRSGCPAQQHQIGRSGASRPVRTVGHFAPEPPSGSSRTTDWPESACSREHGRPAHRRRAAA
jgi:hypothetical protein